MPIEGVSSKELWTTDKVIDSTSIENLDQKIRSGVYNAGVDQSQKHKFKHPIRKIAVIGAGPAGLPTAKHLLDEGIEVKIFERNSAAGGTWIYHKEKPLNPKFPSTVPTRIVRPSLPPDNSVLPFKVNKSLSEAQTKEELLHLNPPTPCYQSLRNNVPTPLIKYKDLNWREDTPWFTTHEKILEYLQDYANHFRLNEITEFNTSVEKLEELPDETGWNVTVKQFRYTNDTNDVEIEWKQETFDAVVVATGHYHAPFIPNFPGLSEWRKQWPENVIHSKQYRIPEQFKDKSVLLIGGGVSAIDISRDIAGQAKVVYSSIRKSSHAFDIKHLQLRKELSKLMSKQVKRLGNIRLFRFKKGQSSNLQEAIVEFEDGTEITNLDYVIVCTGYVFNFHFLEQLHSDDYINGTRRQPVNDAHVLVKDGAQVFNLHKDVFYIPNPTLSFVGIPFHIATFSLFEFQSYAIARTYSGTAELPSEKGMRAEWNNRQRVKGSGKEFHALGSELEIAYINDILRWINEDGRAHQKQVIEGHNEEWIHIKSQNLIELKKSLNVVD
ncbi:Thiol-specific monooxygenase [Choanephora cucurbitarum]|uniref:Thiol-specific monooxygenase n=1 Tax=Choanephora cucurbitarum TaxID=101091 RepID=A0A1C7N345_9FUNG|nr:Thiol-specific monooxygenase [Choanephora cucurbitarum]